MHQSVPLTTSPQPGQIIERYRLDRLISRGGNSELWQARGPANQRAALKHTGSWLGPELLGYTRLLLGHEAAILQALPPHPDIVRVIDAPHRWACDWIVLEWLEGAHLGAIRARLGRLTWPHVARCLKHLLPTLEHLHWAGVIHGDIKPDNLMPAGEERVMLIDFGGSRVRPGHYLGFTLAGGQSALGPQQPLVSHRYSPPEQWAAGSQLDVTSDLYALGATLYELLAGHPPFLPDNEQEAVRMHTEEPASPIQSRVEGLPAAVTDVIMACLEKDPGQRPESAARIRMELTSLLD